MAGPDDFDFWLGTWTATWGETEHGSNRVQRTFNDLVVEERFDGRPGADFRGMSVSVYDRHRERWLQTWVDDSGNYFALEGARRDDEVTLLCDRHNHEKSDTVFRMRFYDIEPHAFTWSWERSDDRGASFKLGWQIAYKRAEI